MHTHNGQRKTVVLQRVLAHEFVELLGDRWAVPDEKRRDHCRDCARAKRKSADDEARKREASELEPDAARSRGKRPGSDVSSTSSRAEAKATAAAPSRHKQRV